MNQRLKTTWKNTKIELPKWFFYLAFSLAVFGAMDASYLTYQHFAQDSSVVCPIMGAGCDRVLTSHYSEIFGLPTALYGLVYYFSVLVLLVLLKIKQLGKYLVAVAGLTMIGFLFSVYLVYLQLFTLQAICFYCMGSALSTTGLFGATALVLWGTSQQQSFNPNNR